MKNIISSYIITILLFVFSAPVHSQISLNRIKRQAERSVERAIDKKIEKELDKAAQRMVDKYWDRVIGKYYQDMYQTGTDEAGEPIYPFEMSSNAKLKDAYTFDNRLKMRMDTYHKNGDLDESVFIHTFTHSSENYLGTSIESKDRDDNLFIINDFDHESMVMLTEENGEKKRIAFAFTLDDNALKEMNQTQATNQDIINYKEIGTKKILGYSCKGYLKEDDKNVSEVWISEKPIPGTEKAAAMLSKNKDANVPSGYPKGSLMETTVTDKKNQEKFVMKVVEIDTKSKAKYVIADYADEMTN